MNDDRSLRNGSNAREGAGRAQKPNGSTPAFFTDEERARLEDRLTYIAQRRFRFREDVAANLVQEALEAYLEARSRYAEQANHSKIVVGILRNRCREHIRRQFRLASQRNAISDVMPQADVPSAMTSGVLDDLAAREARQLIFEALSGLGPKAREAYQFLRGATRLELLNAIEHVGLSKNATDRREFRQILARCGILV